MTVFSDQYQYRRTDLVSMPEERTIKGWFPIERHVIADSVEKKEKVDPPATICDLCARASSDLNRL